MLVNIIKSYKTSKSYREKSFIRKSHIFGKKYRLSGAQALFKSETEKFKLLLTQWLLLLLHRRLVLLLRRW